MAGWRVASGASHSGGDPVAWREIKRASSADGKGVNAGEI